MLRSLVGTRVQVFSLPSRGAFHLSLSVLLHYRSFVMFSLGPWSAQIQPEFHVLRPTQVFCTDRDNTFAYRTFTLYGRLSQYRSTSIVLDNCLENLQISPTESSYPNLRNACRLARKRFRLLPFRSPLLRESLRFLFYPATEMFHFADFAPA